MKHFRQVALLAALALAFTGCGAEVSSARKADNGSAVENALIQQMAAADTAAESSATEASETSAPTLPAKKDLDSKAASDVDYDLTQMNSDMVYATVYSMMAEPNSYIGKTVKMSGSFYPFTSSDGTVYYPACVIEDALACCAQGMEFVMANAAYPDDYPEMGTVITVTGTFETYLEDGSTYCHLANAALETNS